MNFQNNVAQGRDFLVRLIWISFHIVGIPGSDMVHTILHNAFKAVLFLATPLLLTTAIFEKSEKSFQNFFDFIDFLKFYKIKKILENPDNLNGFFKPSCFRENSQQVNGCP